MRGPNSLARSTRKLNRFLKKTLNSIKDDCHLKVKVGDDNVSDVFINSEGFYVLSTFHQICLLPYYGLRNARFLGFFGAITSICFIALFLFTHVPGIIFYHDFDVFSDKGAHHPRSAELVSMLLVVLELSHIIDNDIVLLFKRKKFLHLYRSIRNMAVTHRLILDLKSRQHLLFAAWIIVIFNVGLSVIEIVLLYPIVLEDTHHEMKGLITLPVPVHMVLVLTVRAFGFVHSKAIDSLIVYICLMAACFYKTFTDKLHKLCLEKNLEVLREGSKVINANSCSCRKHLVDECLKSWDQNYKSEPATAQLGTTFEDVRITLQKLAGQVNHVLSPCLFLTVSANLVNVCGGIFVGMDVFEQYGNHSTPDILAEIYNALVCLISLSTCCIVADRVNSEAIRSMDILRTARLTKLEEADYKSVTAMLEMAEENRLVSIGGSNFFVLNKKFIFTFWCALALYGLILIQKY